MSKWDEEQLARLRAKPKCFTDKEWAAWLAATTMKPGDLDYACTDCTPKFKRQMMSARRCSWTCVEFFQYGEEGIEGRRMSVAGGLRPPRVVDGVTIIPIKVK